MKHWQTSHPVTLEGSILSSSFRVRCECGFPALGGDPSSACPQPSMLDISISLPPVLTSRACQGRNDSHEVALGLIKTCQCSAPLGTRVSSSPQSHMSLSSSAHSHSPGTCMRGAGQLTWPWSEVTGTRRGNLRLWAGRKASWLSKSIPPICRDAARQPGL